MLRRSAALRALLQDVVTVTDDDGGGEPGGINNTRVHGYLVRADHDAPLRLTMTSY